MLGFGSIGQLTIGELPRGSAVLQPGSGAAHQRFDYLPGPAYDKNPNKPFRPIWDRGGKVEKPEPVEAAPRPVPLPPASIFAQPAPADMHVSGMPPFGLPDFNNLVPPDSAATGQRLREAQDLGDALAVLASLATIKGPDSVN